ncbi:MAG: hypothetical protein KatS3mg115_1814 [Candidatus Poribacteria bacterium]|nr:MAG: hypothetical protein KatS3mg115_1814 [Candidatus Poribacteria bacterium]
MFSKIVVKGEGIHPLYRFLTQEQPNEKLRGEIEWNFAKFLIGRDGQVIARFHPRVTPDDPKLIQALEQALAAPRPERSSQPAEEESGA